MMSHIRAIHYYPTEEEELHSCETAMCPCIPRIEYENEVMMVIHREWSAFTDFAILQLPVEY